MSIKQNISRIFVNLIGWRTNQKILVLESDDWGSIRMPSAEVYKKCLKAGYRVDLNPYERCDSIESEDDLNILFDLLSRYKDIHNNHPVITANCCVANPDFEKIMKNNFTNYEYEHVTETFQKSPKHTKSFGLWKKGISEKLFFPQLHAREHLNVPRFMKALRNKDDDVLFGFNNKMPGMIKNINGRWRNIYVSATHFVDEESKNYILESYIDALKIFYELFGFKSESLIPANFTWSDDFNDAVSKMGIKYIQGNRKYRVPVQDIKKYKYHSVYLGKQNNYNQRYLVRNAIFEPTLTKNKDEHLKCLNEIGIAFKMKKPAIISSHRLNFIGSIDIKNRDRNLRLFSVLIKEILKKWPDVLFMNSVQLGRLIDNENRNS